MARADPKLSPGEMLTELRFRIIVEGTEMSIAELMSSPLITIRPDQSLSDARLLLDEHSIRHLPVVDSHGSLVGIVTDRDVREAWASDATLLERHELEHALHHVKIRDIMTTDVASVGHEASVAEGAYLAVSKNIGSVVVLDSGQPCGIVTLTDFARLVARGHPEHPQEARVD